MSRLMGLVFTRSALGNVSRFPHKIRAQLIKKAKALILDPHPPGSKKLAAFTTEDGESVYRQRSGDLRILYVVRSNEVIILDINYGGTTAEHGSGCGLHYHVNFN